MENIQILTYLSAEEQQQQQQNFSKKVRLSASKQKLQCYLQ